MALFGGYSKEKNVSSISVWGEITHAADMQSLLIGLNTKRSHRSYASSTCWAVMPIAHSIRCPCSVWGEITHAGGMQSLFI